MVQSNLVAVAKILTEHIFIPVNKPLLIKKFFNYLILFIIV